MDHDVIVIGSGAAGHVASKVLCEGGARTLLLEAGPPAGPRRDLAHHRPSPRGGGYRARIDAALRGQRVQARSTAFNTRYAPLYVNDAQQPYTTAPGQPFSWIRGQQLGGRLHTWSRMSPRFSDRELRASDEDGVGHPWPLSSADLAPWYERVERWLGLAGAQDALAHLPDGCVDASHPMTAQELHFKRSVEHRWPQRRVLCARVLGNATTDVPRGVQEAMTTHRLTVRTDCRALRVLSDPATGLAVGVEALDTLTGAVHRHRAAMVVVCASAFESVRLLLNSAASKHPQGMGNHADGLGRGIMDHLLYTAGGRVPDALMQPSAAAPAPRDVFDFDSQGWYMPRPATDGVSAAAHSRGFGLQGGIGRDGPWWWLAGFGEMRPHAHNRATLHPTRHDRFGVPLLHIAMGHDDNDRRLLDALHVSVREMAMEAGLQDPRSVLRPAHAFGVRSWAKPGRMRPGLAIHECGGAAMGDDPSRSVADPFGRLWHAPNVVVADAAVFPSCGYQNPTLTIMALAWRAVDRLLARAQ